MKTRTGGFEIGFRRGWSEWQKDLDGLLSWAKEQDLGVIDLGGDTDQIGGQVGDAGLKIGTADLKSFGDVIGEDKARQKDAVDLNASYIEECVKHGVKNFFTVLIPQDKGKSRRENFAIVAEGLQLIAPVLDKHGAHLVIEGWPGPGALACTPEGYRAVFKEVPSPSMAVNFDPSHLLRMGIDPLRFLEEFAPRVKHVHGKDTELLSEGLYEYGHEQPPTFGKERGFGSMSWRYTIPGHGAFRWVRGFQILKDAGYSGAVCIELEDENFNTDEAGEKQGLLAGALFLESC
ncbi:MAG TPA: sugar phosphate isomerase/epimerase [Fimbriimonas sp.]|nr:sugar phosphate isomerase/epimerase [Fimbriimonas sp.]